MSFIGLVVPADGSPVRRERIGDDGKRPQEIVGGYIEMVQGPLGIAAYINVEGKLKGLPINHRATQFLSVASPFSPGYDPIVGDVVLFDASRNPLDTSEEGDAPEWLDERI